MNNNDQEFLIQKIRTQYTEKEHTKLDSLKELDRKVKRPVNVFAYTFGTVSAIVMGCGMSLIMTDLGETLGLGDVYAPGIIIGIAGIIMAVANYPLYRKIMDSRRKKYAHEIIALSDELMKN